MDRPPRFRHVFFILAVSAVLMSSIDSTIVATPDSARERHLQRVRLEQAPSHAP